jgi:CUB/sushi domain-containing protein
MRNVTWSRALPLALAGFLVPAGCQPDADLPVPDTGVRVQDVVEPTSVQPRSAWTDDDGAHYLRVEFEGTFDPETGRMSFDSFTPLGGSTSGFRTANQPMWCTGTLRVVQDNVPGSGPADSLELETELPIGYYGDCDPVPLPDGVPSLGDLGETDGALCASVTVRSFYGEPIRDLYAWIYEVAPLDNRAYTWADRVLRGLGTGAQPPTGAGAPSDNLGGLFYYGDILADDPEARSNGTFDNAVTVPWTFRYPVQGAPFSFRGQIVARFVETCNGLDDDCDGRVDEDAGCFPQGFACQGTQDCAPPNECLLDQSTGQLVCGGELLPEDCTGTVDTNGNGLIGCLDPTCSGVPPCPDFSCGRGNLGSAIALVEGQTVAQGTHDINTPSDVEHPFPSHCGSRILGADTTLLWTAPVSGTYIVTTEGSTFDTALLLLPGTCPLNAWEDVTQNRGRCTDSLLGVGGETIVFSAAQGQPFFFVVDSKFEPTFTLGRGTWKLSVFRIPVCGDSVLDEFDRFGNRVEECDAGGVDTATCNRQCTFARCGDDYINPVIEQCEDGNLVPGDGCSPTCTTEPGWICDPTGCWEDCGDGMVVGNEVCDDTNNFSGDGCAEDCSAIEVGWACPVPGVSCAEICGDGLVVGAEVCDSPGADGCDDNCRTVRPGYLCPPLGGNCQDIDECAEELDTCSVLATCINTPGSFECECLPGFVGNGIVCVDDDECANSPCDPFAICTNTTGGFECACPSGFTGNGFTCTDINECLVANGNCDALTTCTNVPGSRTCGPCPAGYAGTGDTACIRRDCGDPGVPANATRTTTPVDFALGSTVVHACNTGFVLTAGNLSRTCQPSGPDTVAFSGAQATCAPRPCPAPVAPANATLTDAPQSYAFGQTATFACNAGFDLQGAPALTTFCQADGTFGSPTGSCVPRDCGALSAPANGTVSAGATTFGTTRNYACNTGFTLIGASTTTCEASGAWSATQPTCQIVNCGTPPAPANAVLSAGAWTFNFNETLNFTCNPGYLAQGSLASTCQASGAWTSITGSCQPRDCGVLPAPANGTISVGGTTFGITRSLACNTGYLLSGSESRTCQADGTWSGVPTVCTLSDCGPAPVPTFGSASASGTTFGSTVTWSCDAGFTRTAGDASGTCGAGGWQGTVPTCSRVSCPSVTSGPQAPANATIVSGGSGPHVFEDSVTFACNTGFAFTGGNLTRDCLSSGAWSGSVPVCTAITCANPGVPSNAFVVAPASVPDQTAFNGTIQFQCDNGFDPVGSELLTCTGAASNGGWNFPLPSCQPGDCGQLAPVPNATVVPDPPSSLLNSVANYTCNSGYVLTSGNAERICAPTAVPGERAWTGTAPVCTPVSCGVRSTPAGQVLTGGPYSNTFSEVRTYTCAPGFQLSTGSDPGILSSTCGLHPTLPNQGQWTAPAGTCVPVDCGALAAPANGTASGSGTTFGSSRSFACNNGFVLQGSASRTCGADGQWSGTATSCQPASCGSLSNPTNGTVSTTSTVTGGQATYTCNAGFQLSGTSPRSCNATGPGTSAWSGTPPTCVPRTCTTLPTPTNGNAPTYTSAQNFNSVATFTCQSGYRLTGNSQLTCALDGGGPNVAWNGSPPSCVLIECPNPPVVNNAAVSTPGGRAALNNAQALYTCNDGFEPQAGTSTSQTCTVDASQQGVWQWNGTPLECVPRSCPAAPVVANAGAPSVSGLTLNSTAAYTCNTGFVTNPANPLATTQTATCSFVGGSMQWTNVPTCQRVSCGDWTAPAATNTSGTVNYSAANNRVFQGTADRTCIAGHRIGGTAGGAGVATATCQATGAWAVTSGNCQMVTCPAPAALHNGGTLQTAASTSFGAVMSYQCPAGTVSSDADTTRRNAGQFIRTCGGTALGAWADSGQCVPVECPALSPPANRIISTSVRTFGTAVTLDCDNGFQRNAVVNLVCGINTTTPTSSTGTWRVGSVSGSAWASNWPTCTAQTCTDLPGITFGTITYSAGAVNNRPLNSVASQNCLSGTTPSITPLPAQRTCTGRPPENATGIWSGATLTCADQNFCSSAPCGQTIPGVPASGVQTCAEQAPPNLFTCSCPSGYNQVAGTGVNGPATCQAACGNAVVSAPEVCDLGSNCNGPNPAPECSNRCEGRGCDSVTRCNNCTSQTTGVNRRCSDGGDNDNNSRVDGEDERCTGIDGWPTWNRVQCGGNGDNLPTIWITGWWNAGSGGVLRRLFTGTGSAWVQVNEDNYNAPGGDSRDGAFVWRPIQDLQFRRYRFQTDCTSGMDPYLLIRRDNGSDPWCTSTGWTWENSDIDSGFACIGGNFNSRIDFDANWNAGWHTVAVDHDTDCFQNVSNNYRCRTNISDLGCASGFIPDLNGHCQPASWVGDAFCDNGGFSVSGALHPAVFWNGGIGGRPELRPEVCDCAGDYNTRANLCGTFEQSECRQESCGFLGTGRRRQTRSRTCDNCQCGSCTGWSGWSSWSSCSLGGGC